MKIPFHLLFILLPVFCQSLKYSLFFIIDLLQSDLVQRVPKGYELKGYEDVQNRWFEKNSSMYQYRQCKECNYELIAYGKPYSILLEPTLQNDAPNRTVIMICTQPRERYLRHLFREATKSIRQQYHLSYFFTLTQDNTVSKCMERLQKEQDEYHDLLVFNHTNSYTNLALTVLLTYHYLQSLELSSRYIVKMDADVAVNLRSLMNILYSEEVMEMKYVYLGDCMSTSYNTVLPQLKNYVPMEIIEEETWIDSYARGGLYILSSNSIVPMLIATRHFSFITHHEDAVIGRAMYKMNIVCKSINQEYWLARYGCEDVEDCKKYLSIHPTQSARETKRFYYIFST